METPAQQPQTGLAPIATPGFNGAAVPGLPAQVSDPNAKAQGILELLKQIAQRKQMANTAVPQGIPQGGDIQAAQQIGMHTGNPNAWGTQRFLATTAASIKDAVKNMKEKQLLSAEGDWSYLQSAMNEKFAAEQSGDQQSAEQAEKKIQAVLGDPKKLKNMTKALNQDWLNPEKTTVYGEALKRVTAKQQQADAQNGKKHQAAQGLKAMFQHLIGRATQPQLSDDERQRMAREIEKKAPTTTTGVDKQTVTALLEQQKEEARAAAEAKKEEARAKEQEEKFEREKQVTQMKQDYQTKRDQVNNQFRESIERMRSTATDQRQNNHDLMMMKALGMKLDAQQEKLFKPDPTKLNKEVSDSVGTMKQQLNLANANLRSLKTAAANHPFTVWNKDEVKEAEDQVKSLEKAVNYIEKNRDGIIKGKMELSDVVDKAQELMTGGGEEAPPPPPVPGAVVKQVQ